MIRPTKRIKDENGNVLDIPLNDTEFNKYEAEIAEFEAIQKAKDIAKLEKAAAEAKLEALGLTPADLAALGL